MKVMVKAKSEEKNSVLLGDEHGMEQWFTLADRVNMTYIHPGPAEATVDIAKNVVTYLKMEKSQAKPGFKPKTGFGPAPTKPESAPQEEKKFYKTKHMVLEGLTGEELRTGLDIASDQNWVIATQTHFVDGKWYAVIYYKVKPE